jgi:hypothetical protein
MTSIAEPGGEAGNDTAAGVSGLSAAALASWGMRMSSGTRTGDLLGAIQYPGGFERRLSSGDLALERGFRAVSTPAHSQGGAAPSCGPPPASATSSKHAPRRACTAGASATSYAGRPPVPWAAGQPQSSGGA